MNASEISIISSQGTIEFQIEQPAHGELRHAMSDSEAAFAIQRIGQAAWSASEWLDIEASKSYTETPGTLTRQLFNANDSRLLGRQTERIVAAGSSHGTVEYFLGAIRDIHYVNGQRLNPVLSLAAYEPQGFAKITRDGEKPGAIKYVQRATNLGMYACIHDLNVAPQAQGRGLGTALAFAGLSNHSYGLKATLYTALSNESMQAWARKYGYVKTDEYESPLFAGQSVAFARYEAPRVGAVLERMQVARPELTYAARLSITMRRLQEQAIYDI